MAFPAEVVSISISVAAVVISGFALYFSGKESNRVATEKVFDLWWGKELSKNRRFFLDEFMPNRWHVAAESEMSMKDVFSSPDVLEESESRQLKDLMYFFDRVGWLGAAGLIDVDFVLGPMQHTMRRVWLAMHVFVERERANGKGLLHDPVYFFGFEWLFKRSGELANTQSELVSRKFRMPDLLTEHQKGSLKTQIEFEESNFASRYLGGPK